MSIAVRFRLKALVVRAERYVSPRDLAFIAAAYAIPLPGTALLAALIVGARRGGRRLQRRWRPGVDIIPGAG